MKGIPMARDIAVVIGILSLLGNRVRFSLKVFLTAVAIVDDIGAVLVIAVFYTPEIARLYLAFGGAQLLPTAKLAIFIASLFSGIVGWLILMPRRRRSIAVG
jgi:NhaA family Na+:H+ antiporter